MKKVIGIFIMMVFTSPSLYAQEAHQKSSPKDWEVSGTLIYDRGKYGGSTLIHTYEFDTTLKRFFEKGDISLIVPFVTQRGDSQLTLVRGSLQRIRKIHTSTVTKSGIGDIYMNGAYYLLSEGKDNLDLDLDGYLKFPTASRSDGLGTGEFDAGPGISLGKRFLSDWRAFIDLYYIFIGSPSGLDLRKQTSFDIGASYDLTREATASIAYEQSRSVIKGGNDSRDLALGIHYKIDSTLRIFGGIAFGLSDGAADQSIHIGAGIKF